MNNSPDYYRNILERCVAAWNRSDPEGTASFYAAEMDYQDPNVPGGIFRREDFVRYLRILFRQWPVQEWVASELLAHATPGVFTACYSFRFANRRGVEIKGRGIDRLEFRGDQISRNWVFLNAEAWPRWVREESRVPVAGRV